MTRDKGLSKKGLGRSYINSITVEKKSIIILVLFAIIFFLGYIIGNMLPIFTTTLDNVNSKYDECIKDLNTAFTYFIMNDYKNYSILLNKSEKILKEIKDVTSPYELRDKYTKHLRYLINSIYNIKIKQKINKDSLSAMLNEIQNFERIGGTMIKVVSDEDERLQIKRILNILKFKKYDILDYISKNNTSLEPYILFNDHYMIYKWTDYNGKTWQIELVISEWRYKKYKMLSHKIPPPDERILDYVTPNDPYIRELAEFFNNTYKNKEDKINCVLSFVQSIKILPEEKTEYFRYPIETLVDGGDCEDKSILFASIMKAMGFDVAFITFPYHQMVGVSLDSVNKAKNPCFFEPIFLFSTDMRFAEELDNKTISKELFIIFKNNNIFLKKDNIYIEVIERGKIWKIVSDGLILKVEKEENKLKVYYDYSSNVTLKKYYVCETLRPGFKIGELPKEFEDQPYMVLPIYKFNKISS